MKRGDTKETATFVKLIKFKRIKGKKI